MVKDAWDEQVIVSEAWDEEVLVKEAWDETILVKEAWDEVVTLERTVKWHVCKGCEANGLMFNLLTLSKEERIAHEDMHMDKGEESGWYSWYIVEEYEEVIHHEAEYSTVHHPAEYQTVHHDAVCTTVHHDAEYQFVTKCKYCGLAK